MKLQRVCIYLPLDVRVIAVVPMVRKHLFTLGDQSVWLLTPNPCYLHSLLKNTFLSLQKIKILKRHILSFERQPRNIIKSNPQLWQIGNHCLLLPRLSSALFPYWHSSHQTVIQQYTFFVIFHMPLNLLFFCRYFPQKYEYLEADPRVTKSCLHCKHSLQTEWKLPQTIRLIK